IVADNGLYLCVDVIRVTRRDSNLHSAQLITRVDINKRRSGSGVHMCSGGVCAAADRIAKDETISVARYRSESWAAARAHRGAVDAVGAVQIQIVLDGRRKTARPNCCDDAGSHSSHVCQFQACDVLALRIKTVSGARTGPCYSAVIREVETGFRA